MIEEGKYKGMIGVGGLVLARIPEEIAKARDDYYAEQTRDMNEALEHDLKGNNIRVCLSNRIGNLA